MIRALSFLLCMMPGIALACALPPSVILTLPTGHYITAAALTVALTAMMGIYAQRLPDLRPRLLWERRVWLPVTVSSYLSSVCFLALFFVGLFGARDPMHNLLTLVFWTGVWIFIPLASMLVGNIWQAINPWTGLVRITRLMLGRTGNIGLARYGAWPAVLGFAGFSWFQMISLAPEDPMILAQVLGSYWLIIFLLAVAEGEDWLAQGEFLTLLMGLLAKVAPLWREPHGPRVAVMVGWPGAQILTMRALSLSHMAFVTLVLAALTFDGLMDTFFWQGLIGENPLEPTGRSAVQGVNSLGLTLVWLITIATIWAVIRLGQLQPGPVMLSFLAIAAGYHAAHYFVTLLTAGQYTLAALNDPFFRGDSYLGLDTFFVSFGFLTDPRVMPLIYAVQFAAILGAHLLAVLLSLKLSRPAAEDLQLAGPISGAGTVQLRQTQLWAHLPMTVLMVGYTVLGLWLLSTARSG